MLCLVPVAFHPITVYLEAESGSVFSAASHEVTEVLQEFSLLFARLSLYAVFRRCLTIWWPSTGLTPVLYQEVRTGHNTPNAVFQVLNRAEKSSIYKNHLYNAYTILEHHEVPVKLSRSLISPYLK